MSLTDPVIIKFFENFDNLSNKDYQEFPNEGYCNLPNEEKKQITEIVNKSIDNNLKFISMIQSLPEYKNINKEYSLQKLEYSCNIDINRQYLVGITSGFRLEHPYTLEEVLKYENALKQFYKIHSYKLPKKLRDYLLFVSREICDLSYPYIIDLTTKKFREFEDPLIITKEEYYKNNEDSYDYSGLKILRRNVFLQIGDTGCGGSYIISVYGKEYGKIYGADCNNYCLCSMTNFRFIL